MKKYVILIIAILLVVTFNQTRAEIKGYKVIAKSEKDNITIFSKEWEGLYRDFKIDFKGSTYSRPYWMNATNPTYAPEIIYQDINNDKEKELIIILTKGYGTGVLDQDVYVYRTTNGLNEVLVDHPMAIIFKHIKTKLSTKEAEVRIGDKVSKVDLSQFDVRPIILNKDVGFGSSIKYEVIDHQLTATISAQISPAGFIGEIVIVYEYRDNMYQAKSIEFKGSD